MPPRSVLEKNAQPSEGESTRSFPLGKRHSLDNLQLLLPMPASTVILDMDVETDSPVTVV